MPRTKSYAIVFLSLATAGLGWYSYEQHLELIRLRAAGMSLEERDTWQKKVWALEKEKSGAGDKDALAMTDETTSENADQNGERSNDRMRGDRRGAPNIEAMMALANSPEFQKLLSTQQKGALEARYSALFKNMALTPAEREKFKALLADKQSAVMDVLTAARDQGLTGREGRDQVRSMLQTAQAEVDNSLRGLLGDQRFDEYKTYEATLSQRNTVEQLEKRLSYTQTPLSNQQSEQLIGLLAASSQQGTAGQEGGGFPAGGPGGPGGGRMMGIGGAALGGSEPVQTARITTQAVQQAQGILAQPQLEALQQMQAEQRAQQQIARLLRNTLNPNRQQGGNRSSGGTTTTATPRPGS